MNLGEKIYSLRTAKNLSQGDLAEKLGVSRQSISKWENNSAVPDLEKIIKLSDIFGVSIDSMVKDEATDEYTPDNEKDKKSAETPRVEYVKVVERQPMEGRKIAGIILFCMAFLLTFGILFAAGSLGGIFYAIPFIICGTICFTVKKHTGLVCSWTMYVIFDVLMQFFTGAGRAVALNTVRYIKLGMIRSVTINLIISWIWLGLTAALVVWTTMVLKKQTVADTAKFKAKLTAGWVVYIVLYAVRRIVNTLWFETVIVPFIAENNMVYIVVNTLINECIFALLILLVINTARCVLNLKKNEK